MNQQDDGKSFGRGNAAHGGLVIPAPREDANFTDRFDFLVPHLAPNAASDADLDALGNAMRESDEAKDADPVNNKRLPSGYTYFGQFIDHDLTFDPLSKLGGPNKLSSFMNFRTPRFDLDSLYGHGPHDQPYMYDGPALRFGETHDGHADLLRIDAPLKPGDKLAVIGDKRNDENLIVSQIHLSFVLYHNRVVEDLRAQKVSESGIFDIANQIVRWRYQHIALYDYLRRLILPDVFADLQKNGPQFFHTPKGVFMPLEFAVAAFRMGHSMVRFNYTLNPSLDGKELDIFNNDPTKDLRGFRPRPDDRTITWTRFLEFAPPDEQGDPGGTAKTQFSMALDSGLAGFDTALADLPHDVPEDGLPPFVLAQRNLRRGRHLGRGLPSGQTLAQHLGIHANDILSGDRLKVTNTKIIENAADSEKNLFSRAVDQKLTDVFKNDTPLWYYILKEAETLGFRADDAHPLGEAGIPENEHQTNGGRTLGPLGSRIVGEVFFKLLLEDPDSILNKHSAANVPAGIAGPSPKAGQFGAQKDGVFTLADLVKYAHKLPQTVPLKANFGDEK